MRSPGLRPVVMAKLVVYSIQKNPTCSPRTWPYTVDLGHKRGKQVMWSHH